MNAAAEEERRKMTAFILMLFFYFVVDIKWMNSSSNLIKVRTLSSLMNKLAVLIKFTADFR